MGGEGHDGLAVPGRVVLAHEPPFTLGRLRVFPATRQVERDDRNQSVEPRVMQVLVALVRANGGIVTRDELILCCWEGRIVGEDAVNRVLSRIRRVAAGIGENSFSVETITKVGYRLRFGPSDELPAAVANSASPPSPWLSRRTAVAGGVVAAGAGALGVWMGPPEPAAHRPLAEAKQLYDKGMEARRTSTPDGLSQSEAFFREAAELDPNYADAWGMLAIATVDRMDYESEDRLPHVAARAHAAAKRALALDSTQADARLALATLPCQFRRWGPAEVKLLPMLQGSNTLSVVAALAAIYTDVARWDDAIAAYRRLKDVLPFNSGPSSGIALASWAAGNFVEAEAKSRTALLRWPRHPGVWSTRMMVLTYGGKPEAASAFAADPEHHAFGADNLIATRKLSAEAIATRDPELIRQAKALLFGSIKKHFQNIRPAFRLFAALGEVDEAFELLDAYYFRRGRYNLPQFRPIGPFTRMSTDHLFHPPARILWADRRFDTLTQSIGLNSYWRATGILPPHRRG